ncbi:hypothetical protein DWX43_07030 [Clostridium sp. AF19-22AC]|uniref:DUF3877 family protein n=1 Tax=Faecalicatena orotica TaxID=1544 RepID=UPI000E53755B|nr:hypothetical protein DWX43_07030 [Clostridium sp. AF19-22AC]
MFAESNETGEKGRYCIHVPSSGIKYIHENTAGSPFLKAFLDEYLSRGIPWMIS